MPRVINLLFVENVEKLPDVSSNIKKMLTHIHTQALTHTYSFVHKEFKASKG